MHRFASLLPLFLFLALSDQGLPRLKAVDLDVQQISAEPAPVGESVSFMVAAAAEGSPVIDFQFSVAPPGEPFTVVRDFAHYSNQFDWAPMQEGWHVLRVVARDASTGEVASKEVDFEAVSRIGHDQRPVVSSVGHPLVFLYSAPACDFGFITVQFAKVGSAEGWSSTTPQHCDGFKSHNFWIAGLEPTSDYRVKHVIWDYEAGTEKEGPELTFQTGEIAVPLPTGSVLQAGDGLSIAREGILLQSSLDMAGTNPAGTPFAHKLDGTVVWYHDKTARGKLQYILRPLSGGGMFGLPTGEVPGGLRWTDLAGNLVWETNAEATSVRMKALGYPEIGKFHHDALLLPSGSILALASRDAELPGASPGDPLVNGDVLVLLDRNCEVLWVWDAFEKLDVNRKATLGDRNLSPPGLGLPPTEDWTHGNSLEYLPDGNVLFSMRSQDWVIKIDFRDGRGTGDVIWRLGKDGDFTLESNDPWGWFSHQHHPHYDGTRLWIYDNGNTRFQAAGRTGNSRGQVYVLDETAMTARLELNADLGAYSSALGSAQRLGNGNYSFESGSVYLDRRTVSQTLEVSPDGVVRHGYQVNMGVYRSFRMHDLYNPPH